MCNHVLYLLLLSLRDVFTGIVRTMVNSWKGVIFGAKFPGKGKNFPILGRNRKIRSKSDHFVVRGGSYHGKKKKCPSKVP